MHILVDFRYRQASDSSQKEKVKPISLNANSSVDGFKQEVEYFPVKGVL